ncbi:Ugp2 [Columba livia]|nr:Ugp2 [Columba livia]
MSSFAKDFSKAMSQAGTSQFQEVIRQELEYSMKVELDKILATAPSNELEHAKKDLEGFKKLFHRFLQEKGPSVDWGKIQRPPEDSIQPYEKIKARGLPDNIASVLNKLVVVKLNGGLGTSMGCKGPKSLIGVRNENTFLDLTVQQIENIPLTADEVVIREGNLVCLFQCFWSSKNFCLGVVSHLNKSYNTDVPLVLMNSFNTDDDTKKILQKYSHSRVKIYTFNQSRYPRINKETLLPIAKDVSYSGENTECWYPPGHGDIYASFYNSGLLDNLIAEGKEYIFVSNIDNLGATVDLYILNHLMNPPNGKRCEFVMEVTNKTRADVKTLDGGLNVIQLETAVGAAIKSFENSLGINVPRSRFLPVKTTSDLLLVMSNLYSLNAGSLTMSEKREFPTVPLVKLGSSFTKVQDYLRRFESIPDMLELDHLTVSGDVTFGKNVSLKGTVIIIANHGDRIDIPAGALLENKIVSGNLRILDH